MDIEQEYERIRALLAGKNGRQISRESGISQPSIHRITVGTARPSVQMIITLSEYIKRKQDANEPLPVRGGPRKKRSRKETGKK